MHFKLSVQMHLGAETLPHVEGLFEFHPPEPHTTISFVFSKSQTLLEVFFL
jgi:hypothetical protein